MKTHLLTISVCLLFSFMPALSFAQDDEFPAQPPANTADVPLDGGLLLLLAAGAGYGAKKYHQQKKKDSHTTKREKELS